MTQARRDEMKILGLLALMGLAAIVAFYVLSWLLNPYAAKIITITVYIGLCIREAMKTINRGYED